MLSDPNLKHALRVAPVQTLKSANWLTQEEQRALLELVADPRVSPTLFTDGPPPAPVGPGSENIVGAGPPYNFPGTPGPTGGPRGGPSGTGSPPPLPAYPLTWTQADTYGIAKIRWATNVRTGQLATPAEWMDASSPWNAG